MASTTSTMSFSQKLKSVFYPPVMWLNKLTGIRASSKKAEGLVDPPVSIYNYEVQLNNGEVVKLENFKGKKLLLVNTASDCIYTRQYEMLQTLWEQNKDRLMVIAFPANDFGAQEQGTDSEIAKFCSVNYGVTFPLASKSTVIHDEDQHPVYQWLTQKDKNGWNDQPPTWNFSKYLVDEQGRLAAYFDPAVPPISDRITAWL